MKKFNKPDQESELAQRLKDIILSNLDKEQFGVSELAKQLSISRSQLHRKLKTNHNTSISRFIRNVRLEEALKLLKESNQTVSEIAYKVGFNNPSYFINCFHETYGFSPGEFRNNKNIKIINETFDGKNQGKTRLRISKPLVFFIGVISVLVISLFIIFYKEIKASGDYEKSIAILPFENLSSNQDNQHFADGTVEDLLNRLSRIEDLKVISRTSSEMFRNEDEKSISEIARILGVNYILEGTIQREKDQIKINIQLIDAKNDNHILARQYYRNLTEIFAVQSEIASEIAHELSTFLSRSQLSEVKRNHTHSVKAFEYYQMGQFHWKKRTSSGHKEAIRYFNMAIEQDPYFADAYAQMGHAYFNLAMVREMTQNIARDSAVKYASEALMIDYNNEIAHNVLADVYTYFDWDWENAEREHQRSISINSNYAHSRQGYAEFLYMTRRFEEADYQLEKAIELNPLAFFPRRLKAHMLIYRGQYEEALEEIVLNKTLHDNHIWTLNLEFDVLYLLGREQEALESFVKKGELYHQYNPAIADSVYENEGINGLVKVKIDNEPKLTYKAGLYAIMGEYQTTLDLLEESLENKTIGSWFLLRYESAQLKDHPRYKAIITKMGLDPYINQ